MQLSKIKLAVDKKFEKVYHKYMIRASNKNRDRTSDRYEEIFKKVIRQGVKNGF